MKILVVDDDVAVARAIQRGLRGHLVSVEHDGRSAIATVAAAVRDGAPFDLVLCDLTMPHMNGREVLAHLRAQPDPSILVQLSGDLTSDDHDDPIADGALMKPCRVSDIIALVATIRLARSRAATQPLPCLRRTA